MNQSFKEIANIIGLSEAALEVYFFLSKSGELPTDKLMEVSELSPEELQNAIDELTQKHLITPQNNSNQQILFARTILEMQEQAERHLKMLEDLKYFILPKIHSDENKKFFRFQGWEEIRQVYIELLEEAYKSKSALLAFENNVVNNNLGDDFVKKYIDLRVQYKVKAYVICPNSKQDQKYRKEFSSKYTEIKLIPNLHIDENINVSKSVVMSFSPETLDGDFHRNKSKANTLESIFWKIWNAH